jgi:hypothetical protein
VHFVGYLYTMEKYRVGESEFRILTRNYSSKRICNIAVSRPKVSVVMFIYNTFFNFGFKWMWNQSLFDKVKNVQIVPSLRKRGKIQYIHIMKRNEWNIENHIYILCPQSSETDLISRLRQMLLNSSCHVQVPGRFMTRLRYLR